MDKRMYITAGLLMLVVMGYYAFLVNYVYPRHPEWDTSGRRPQPTVSPEQGPATGPSPTAPSIAAAATQSAQAPPGGAAALKAVGASGPGTPAFIGSDKVKDPEYALGVRISPDGAGLDSVIINETKAVDAIHEYTFQEPDFHWRALATRRVSVDGQSVDLTDVNWTLESSNGTSATYGIDILSIGGKALLHLSQTYQVEPRGPRKNRDNTSAGYGVSVTYRLRNLTGGAERVRIDFDGPAMPPRETERGDDRQIVAGYDRGDQAVDVTRLAPAEFKTGEVRDLSRSSKGYKLLWVGATSLYFGAIVQPQNKDQVLTARATVLNEQAESDQREIALEMQTSELTVDGNQAVDVPLKIFFGPKHRSMLEGDYYADYPRSYSQLLVTTTGICGLCAFPWLVDRLVDLLWLLQWILHDWGLAIIALVLIVRLMLHPITRSSQVSMMKMQKMGPEVERLKKKYGDDKEAFTKAQMQMYKEMGFTPILGCLPMFLQMPIWIALYSALQNEFELRQAPFLFTYIHDLARPDRLISWDTHAFVLPLISLKIASLNVLPIIMAVTFFLQQKYTPKPPTTTPEQQSQQKIMQWMTLLFPIFLYSAPSGLNLYILTSTAIGVWESKRIRDHIKRREEAEKAQKVFVDTKPTRHGKQSKKQEAAQKAQAKPGCIAGWWANLQARAEQMRQETQRRNKNS